MTGNAKKQPLRRCAGCGGMFPKAGLFRVCAAEGGFLLDAEQKLPGRGAYVCRSAECVARAMKNRGLERSLKANVPKPVYEKLQGALDGMLEGMDE